MRPPPEHSAERIRWLLAQKELACARYVRGVATTLAVSENELRALLCIARHGNVSPGLLGLRTGLSAQSASAIASRLVDAGMVERLPHRHDGRSSVLRVTEQTAAALQAAFANLTARIDDVFARLPDRDRRIVDRFLEQIADASAEAAAPSVLPAIGSHAPAEQAGAEPRVVADRS